MAQWNDYFYANVMGSDLILLSTRLDRSGLRYDYERFVGDNSRDMFVEELCGLLFIVRGGFSICYFSNFRCFL